MVFLEQFIETLILSEADQASEKGNKKLAALWLMAFVLLIVLAVGFLWVKDLLAA